MNKTGLIAKISIKYVLPTCIWIYFWRISWYFAFLGEFRGISRKYLNIAGPRPRKISEALTIISVWKGGHDHSSSFFMKIPHQLFSSLSQIPVFFCNGSKTDTLKRLMYRFIIGLFLKLRKSTFQQKKNYGVLMKPSELFVLKDTVIFLALKFFPSQCLCEK